MESSDPQPVRGENHLTIAVGEEQISAAPGSGTSLQIGVMNDGPLAEEVEISVRGVPARWIIGNGRLVYIPAGQVEKILLTIQPPPIPESRVGQYPLEILAAGRSDPDHPALATSLLTVAAYESRGRIGMLLGTTQFSVVPGSTVHIPILLLNRGVQTDSFQLGMTGLPANWISTDSPITRLAPGESRELMATLHVPRSPQAGAGRAPFVLQLTSQLFPDETAEASCILTIAAFSQFSAALEAGTLAAGQPGRVSVTNQGNTVDTYSLNFQSPGSQLLFQKPVQIARPGPQPGTQRLETGYAEIPAGDRFQVEPGQSAAYPFRSRLRSRPLVGGENSYPYTVSVTSAEGRVQDLAGRLQENALMPVWLPVVLTVGAFGFCLLLLLFSFQNFPTTATATQTAAFNQTQAALAGGVDTDGDGLTDTDESSLGTDPNAADSDKDGLSDGDEVKTTLTNPLLADSDGDGLPDGQEVQQFKTDPRNPDSDADLLKDGDEIQRNTDPKVADSDQDGLGDGAEVSLGTDPRQQDSDKDGLRDGQENQNCPRPLTPDSDADGIIDGNDRDPCNPSNPSLTAAAPTQPIPTQPLPTQPLPTQPLPTAVIPTNTLIPTNTSIPPTLPPAASLTPPAPILQGALLFSSNRDGNSEIYAMNLASQAANRLTNNTVQDIQPALAPDAVQVAYASNQEGNNEIYLGGTDGRAPVNLTHNAAEDQQPTWSPDGSWIAFTSNRDGNQEIYVMRRDGSELRNLTTNPGNDYAPSWYSLGGLFGSEDWIAFTSNRDGNQEIYTIRVNGTGLTNLTNNPAQDYAPTGFPGGQTLAFVSERDGNPEIYTMNQYGGAVTRLTNNPAQDLAPAISSNGWVAFFSDRDGNQEVYVVPTQGGTAYNLTHNPAQDRDPDW
jgi:Tol biopolymer transport system component